MKDGNKSVGMGPSQKVEGPLDISAEKPRVIYLSLPYEPYHGLSFL